MKKMRNVPGDKIQDPSAIHNLEYNNAAGSKKVSEVGRHLLPIPYVSVGVVVYTTDASTKRILPSLGRCLAVYNNAGAVGSVTLGETSAIVSLAAGVTDASGHVGIPCTPNAWTYIACNEQQWVITSAATLMVFIIDDDSDVKQEASR